MLQFIERQTKTDRYNSRSSGIRKFRFPAVGPVDLTSGALQSTVRRCLSVRRSRIPCETAYTRTTCSIRDAGRTQESIGHARSHSSRFETYAYQSLCMIRAECLCVQPARQSFTITTSCTARRTLHRANVLRFTHLSVISEAARLVHETSFNMA